MSLGTMLHTIQDTGLKTALGGGLGYVGGFCIGSVLKINAELLGKITAIYFAAFNFLDTAMRAIFDAKQNSSAQYYITGMTSTLSMVVYSAALRRFKFIETTGTVVISALAFMNLTFYINKAESLKKLGM